MPSGEPQRKHYASPAPYPGKRPPLGRALTACLLLGLAFVGCSADPGWTAVHEPSHASSSRPLDANPASAAVLGREALEKLGYARIIELARQAGFVTTKQVTMASRSDAAVLAMGDAAVAVEFMEVFSEYAVVAGVTSQLDSPLPGPADVVAVGILVIGLFRAGFADALDVGPSSPPASTTTTAPPVPPPLAASATSTPTAAPVPTVTAPPIRAPQTCGAAYPDLRVCLSLPVEYTFPSAGAALAAMKATLGDKGLRLHREERTESGPCPGTGTHFNVRQGAGRAASITCCPCCVDGPPTPRKGERCRIVW